MRPDDDEEWMPAFRPDPSDRRPLAPRVAALISYCAAKGVETIGLRVALRVRTTADTPPEVRMRKVLRRALRDHGLRCVDIGQKRRGEPVANPPKNLLDLTREKNAPSQQSRSEEAPPVPVRARRKRRAA